jgi:hypothetical protein
LGGGINFDSFSGGHTRLPTPPPTPPPLIPVQVQTVIRCPYVTELFTWIGVPKSDAGTDPIDPNLTVRVLDPHFYPRLDFDKNE